MKYFFILTIFSSFLFANNELTDIKINSKEVDFINKINPEKEIINKEDNIKIYSSEKEFTFKDEAIKEAEITISYLKSLNITILGKNVFEKNNNYSFNIEYIETLKEPSTLNSFLIKKYSPNKTYWNNTLNKKALDFSLLNFKNSPLKLIDYEIIEGNDYSFSIAYAVNNILKKSPVYYVDFERFKYGKYTFENQAEKDIKNILNKFRNMSIPAISAKVIPFGNDYSLEITYALKTNKLEPRPEYSIESYINQESFNFENESDKKALETCEIFKKSSLIPLNFYSNEKDNNYFFNIDYLIKNIYVKNNVFKEFSIKTYTNPTTYIFENEAKKAMEEKKNNFNQANLYVISSNTLNIGNDFSFYIEYIEKNIIK